jgi:hypothetical protein
VPSLDLDDIKDFLLTHVEELEELEILLWFHRRPSADWANGSEVVAAHPFSEDRTLEVLARLTARELLVRDGSEPRYRCDPPDPEVKALLGRVLSAYEENPLRFFQIMNANALERVRTAAIRTFAECFRLGGPKANG